MLDGKLQVTWEISGEFLVIELYGKIKEDEYMAFGLSGANGRSQMTGGDVAIAFYDKKQNKFKAEDYYMSHLAQCDGMKGVCPDERIGGKNDVQISKRFQMHYIYAII